MKKLFAMILAIVLVLSLAACGGNSDDSGNVNTMSIIALVMSFIVPLVGFIMGLIYRPKAVAIDDESSRKKCTAAIWISVVYFVLCIVLSIVYSIAVVGIIAAY